MEHLSYIEVNVVCMIILGIIYLKQFGNRSIVSSAQIHMKDLILTSCILCMSDILAIVCRGHFFDGARLMIQISNLVYFESMPLISMFWLLYVYDKTGRTLSKLQYAAIITPVILFSIVAISNPFTKILFSIDENNLYVRGSGVFLHWIVSWTYLLFAGCVSHKAYRNAQSWDMKNVSKPLLIFIVAPTICCAVQMLLYGISAVQVGITISIVLVNFQMLDNRISIDELTGINNRKEMHIYVDRTINRLKPVELSFIMIDVNKFKHINDTLGHHTGDEALRDVASALKRVCEQSNEHLFLCRYGGDEFAIIARNASEESLTELTNMLKSEVEHTSVEQNRPYELSISVGHATDVCESMKDFEKCIKRADDAMYCEKEKIKVQV